MTGVECVPASLGALTGLHAFSAELPGISRAALHSLLLPDTMKALSHDPEEVCTPCLAMQYVSFSQYRLCRCARCDFCRRAMNYWKIKALLSRSAFWKRLYILVFASTWLLLSWTQIPASYLGLYSLHCSLSYLPSHHGASAYAKPSTTATGELLVL